MTLSQENAHGIAARRKARHRHPRPAHSRRADRVKSGRYASASEVVRAGLRALHRKEALLDELLKARVAEALADTRPVQPAEEIRAALASRHARRTSRPAWPKKLRLPSTQMFCYRDYMKFHWICPHCSVPQFVTESKQESGLIDLAIEGQHEGQIALNASAIGCSNSDCRKTTINVKIGSAYRVNTNGYNRLQIRRDRELLFDQRLIPQGVAKPQGDYVPKAIRDDYYEACLIRELSPKAAATLVRRCLQGMIRDFAGISKARLIDEINELRKAVDTGVADRAISIESVDAIDRVRGIGNIGAHMEKDINLIIEVDADEAKVLIELVEMLFEEWYGARERRQERFARLSEIASVKEAAKKPSKSQNSLSGSAGLAAPFGIPVGLVEDGVPDSKPKGGQP